MRPENVPPDKVLVAVCLQCGDVSRALTPSTVRHDRESDPLVDLEPELLRRIVRRRAAGDRQTLRGGATRRRCFLPALKGEVSALEIR